MIRFSDDKGGSMSDTSKTVESAAGAASKALSDWLQPFAGRFRAEVKVWMGEGDPMISTGLMTNEFDLGGRFLRQTYQGDASGGPFDAFEGRGFWGYNTVEKIWEGFWIDNASTIMQIERGEVDEAGKVWTMRGEMTDPGSGKPLTKKSIITLVDEDHHKLEMFFVTPGGEAKGMEITYVRAT
jgi:Protein of unknown function (DUF1579)